MELEEMAELLLEVEEWVEVVEMNAGVAEVVELCGEIDMVHVLGVIDSDVRQDRR